MKGAAVHPSLPCWGLWPQAGSLHTHLQGGMQAGQGRGNDLCQVCKLLPVAMNLQLGRPPGDTSDQAGCLQCFVMLTLLVMCRHGNLCQLVHFLQRHTEAAQTACLFVLVCVALVLLALSVVNACLIVSLPHVQACHTYASCLPLEQQERQHICRAVMPLLNRCADEESASEGR